MQVLLTTSRAWHLPHTARAFQHRQALAGLWMADKKDGQLAAQYYSRCWPYHLAMKPFYHLASQIWSERATYLLAGFYHGWLRRRLHASKCPPYQVAHGIMGFAGTLFDHAEEIGALKVLDCPNSHPTTYYGFWQRECDLWCPGEKVPIPRVAFARMNRELNRADLIIVQSKFCHESMLLNGIPESKIFVNPMGVNTGIFQKRTAVAAKPRFVCVATICVRKGHQYLFRAFEIVKRVLPNAELICVGDYKRDFRQERPKWEGRFIHHPRLTHAEIAQLLPTCTAFVFPSQEEGIGRAQIEAMACGLPVIGTHEGGSTTVISNEQGGLIVNSRAPEQIAAAMIRLATDADFNWQQGEIAFQRAGHQNTWQDYGDRLLSEYQKHLEAKPVITK